MSSYDQCKARLARGWNTWDTFSVFSHVLLPERLGLSLTFRDGARAKTLRQGYIGHYAFSVGPDTDRCLPGPRSYDGRYTHLDVTWRDLRLTVESATDGEDVVLLLTPHPDSAPTGVVAVEASCFWNARATIGVEDRCAVLRGEGREVRIFATGPEDAEPYMRAATPYLARTLCEPIAVSTGRPRSVEDVREVVGARRGEVLAEHAAFGPQEEIYTAMRTCLAWNTVYDPHRDRVISPVSRVWNNGWGSYVLFCWDTFFAGLMAGIDCADLAYANVIEMLREHTDDGFVPNAAAYPERKSRDRSQPCVGGMVAWRLYERWGERWFLEEVFEDLLTWNRWWDRERRVGEGVLAWGSQGDEPIEGRRNDGRKRASLESGLDNSPMYDDAAFDDQRCVLKLADAGLTGLYVGDCRALERIARAIDRQAEADELADRAERYALGAAGLWDEETGIFRNRHTDTGEWSGHLSPTNFYPLIGGVATEAQAQRAVREHLLNPAEFAGEWMLPSISRDNPAFVEQKYWRGPAWGPMNMLVYMGLEQYDLPEARRELAAKSAQLLLKEWRENKHVHENYNTTNGEGCCMRSSNAFYHWGGLLGLIGLIEGGHYRPGEG